MFGSHLSIAGAMDSALDQASRLRLDCVQVFTKNQQQWVAKPLSQDTVRAWKNRLSQLGWAGEGPVRTVSHASYLANLAAVDDDLYDKSIALMVQEVERCEALSIPLLVFHPGAFTSSSLEAGIRRITAACVRVIRQTSGCRTVLCLENVAGQGTTIGREFHELAQIRRLIGDACGAQRVGVCIDTAHAHAAGHDLSTRLGAERVISQIESTLGPGVVRCLHLNDSKTPCGSRVDRHEHIGEGTIGLAGFAAFVNHAGFSMIPKIMETPKGSAKGRDFDTVNVGRLRALVGLNGERFEAIDPINPPASAKPATLAKPARATKPTRPTTPEPQEAPARRSAQRAKPKPGRAKAPTKVRGSASATTRARPAKGP